MSTDSPKLRSLWGVMPQDTPPEPATSEACTPGAASPSQTDAPVESHSATAAPKSLWEVMRGPGSLEETAPEDAIASPNADDSPNVAEIESAALPIDRIAIAPRRPAVQDWRPIVAGAVAIPLSVAAFWPHFWLSLPAAVCGFAALLWSALIWLDASAQPQSRKLAATAGALGLAGILAGPLVFSPLGRSWRAGTSDPVTQRHLSQIGVALSQYQREHVQYPIGGTTVRDAEGRERGAHGWMTALLPYVNAAEVYRQIDFSRPYDDAVNVPAVSTPIEAYFASGGSRAPVGGGFAVSHFAGVGGDGVNARGERAALGIFARNEVLSPKDVADGASHTLVAGEVAKNYPPWCDPQNWRAITQGINRDERGFGNAAGTGAMMLFADGSVRFFSNRTEIEVLNRLSTRNGHD